MSALPHLDAPDPVSHGVLTELEVESRGPGLGMLLRRFGAARPFIMPSLVPATLVLVTVLAATLALAAVVMQMCLGAMYAWSVFVLPIKQIAGILQGTCQNATQKRYLCAFIRILDQNFCHTIVLSAHF